MMNAAPVRIEYFTDILCVWAYLAQIKLDNLQRDFGDRVQVVHRFMSLFGNNEARIGKGWTEGAGGFRGYAEHVRRIVGQFDHVTVHEATWLRNVPASSLPGHLVIKAVQTLADAGDGVPAGSAERYAQRLREAFFRDNRDIAAHPVLMEEAENLGLPVAAIERQLQNGQAHAALSLDLQDQRDKLLEGSPTFVLNEGRQKLYGNIGYRAIAANIQELLDKPLDIPLWC